jgi:uncharacterized protein YceK
MQRPRSIAPRRLPRWSRCGLGVVVALSVSGCATIRTASNTDPGSPKIYGGTRLDSAALSYDRDQLEPFWRYGIYEPAYPAADLPLSVVADTVLLPFTALYVLINPDTWGHP